MFSSNRESARSDVSNKHLGMLAFLRTATAIIAFDIHAASKTLREIIFRLKILQPICEKKNHLQFITSV